MEYTLSTQSRDYTQWTVSPEITGEFDPLSHKLFSNDVFSLADDDTITIHSSPVRKYEFHTGVLILQGNHMFGRTKNGRILYKCIPDDKSLPIFLIAYDMRIGFNKNHKNKYVSFRVGDWDSKHPIGILTETFGDVDNFEAFCSYQLWSKRLVYSTAKFNQRVKYALKDINEEAFVESIVSDPCYNIVDKTKDNVFTIDPQGSVDLDDGFSFEQFGSRYKITVHIANVFAVLGKMDVWEYLTQRVSTIYLPDDRRTLLPAILSDNLCSLLQDKRRITFAMEVQFDTDTGELVPDTVKFFNAVVRVSKNYCYEESKLRKNKDYKKMLSITKQLDTNTIDSHDMVAYWMVAMNKFAAERLYSHQTGVFRVVSSNGETTVPATITDTSTRQVLTSWNNVSGSYQWFSDGLNAQHELLNAKSYVHITSPIRRLVDILNQCLFSRYILDIDLSENCGTFINKYEKETERLNLDMKHIRKIQSECDLLYSCINQPELMNDLHEGVIFNVSDDTYSVYIKSINRVTQFKSTDEYGVYSKHMFKLFLFDAENNGHRKIRIAVTNEE